MRSVNIDKIYSILKKEVIDYKVPIVDLIQIQTKDPFKVLITTILSARTKDGTTSIAAKKLFIKIKKIKDIEKFTQKEIEKLIYPVGFYKTKAKHLKQLPIILKQEFNNKIPETIEELIKLPGVGRKTANLVVTIAFNKPGICVDTHVHKIMNRIGYIETKTPYETEMRLRDKLPKKYWKTINSILVAFGQNLCTPISPHCSNCPINKYCNRLGVKKSR
ncbi:endonuclease III [archaeon]|jgi:endonuclease III|nr:endonuclease III [archaeon]MBT6824339.1 endonuclease III [archaeon]MBT7106889.1 endonuclease III [archaeon]MBT7297441.1 endonuclease III [archaeon]